MPDRARRGFLVSLGAVVMSGLVPAVAAVAHDDHRIEGTLEAVQLTGIIVSQANGLEVRIALDAATKVTREEKKASVLDLQVGQLVVVEAHGDSMDDLIAVTVNIMPPPQK